MVTATVTSFCAASVQYHANQFLPLSDDAIVRKVQSYLATCIPEFGTASVTESAVVRVRRAVTHFSPGKHMVRRLVDVRKKRFGGKRCFVCLCPSL